MFSPQKEEGFEKNNLIKSYDHMMERFLCKPAKTSKQLRYMLNYKFNTFYIIYLVPKIR